MMARPVVSDPQSAPLLAWPEQAEIDALEGERAALIERIKGLPRHSHKRVFLEGRLSSLTNRVLALSFKRRGRT